MIKQLTIIFILLVAMSMSGCLDMKTTGNETMDVISFYPQDGMLICANQNGEYVIFYVNNLMTQEEIDHAGGEDNLSYMPDRLIKSDKNRVYIVHYEYDGGFFFGKSDLEQITAYINSSVIDSKQV